MSSQNYAVATTIGYLAILLWGVESVFVVKVKAIPLFEILTVAYLISFLLTAAKLSWQRDWARLKQPWILWVVGLCGVLGNDILYVSAFKYAPAAQIDLINGVWPVFVIVFAGLLPQEQFRWRQLLGAVVGLFGVSLLITNGHGISGLREQYLPGYALSFSDAVLWSLYTLISRYFGATPVEMVGVYCGLGALFCAVGHFEFEPTIWPNAQQWGTLVILGLSAQGLAYYFWDFGVKRGHFKLLSILSYTAPFISIISLVTFGLTKPTLILAMACTLVTISGFVARSE